MDIIEMKQPVLDAKLAKPIFWGKVAGFTVQELQQDMFDECLKLIERYLIPEEAMCVALDMQSDADSCAALLDAAKECMRDGTSVVVFKGDDYEEEEDEEEQQAGEEEANVGRNECEVGDEESREPREDGSDAENERNGEGDKEMETRDEMKQEQKDKGEMFGKNEVEDEEREGAILREKATKKEIEEDGANNNRVDKKSKRRKERRGMRKEEVKEEAKEEAKEEVKKEKGKDEQKVNEEGEKGEEREEEEGKEKEEREEGEDKNLKEDKGGENADSAADEEQNFASNEERKKKEREKRKRRHKRHKRRELRNIKESDKNRGEDGAAAEEGAIEGSQSDEEEKAKREGEKEEEENPQDEAGQRVVGVMVARVVQRLEHMRSFSRIKVVQGDAYQKWLALRCHLQRTANLFAEYDIDTYYRLYHIVVHPDHRKKGVGSFLARLAALRLSELFAGPGTICTAVAPSRKAQRLLARERFRPHTMLNYHEWKDEQGQQIFNNAGVGNYNAILAVYEVVVREVGEPPELTPLRDRVEDEAEQGPDPPTRFPGRDLGLDAPPPPDCPPAYERPPFGVAVTAAMPVAAQRPPSAPPSTRSKGSCSSSGGGGGSSSSGNSSSRGNASRNSSSSGGSGGGGSSSGT